MNSHKQNRDLQKKIDEMETTIAKNEQDKVCLKR